VSFKIYHNHIPRTGGSYFLQSLSQSGAFDHIKKYWRDQAYFDLANEEKVLESDFVSGHFGIDPNLICPDINTVTMVRNPVKRVISHFVSMIRLYKTEPIFSEDVREDLVKLFDSWLNSDLDMMAKSNFQARFLTNTLSRKYLDEKGVIGVPEEYTYENDKPILTLLADSWGIDNKEPTFEDAMGYLSKCILVGKTEKVPEFTESFFNLLNINFNLSLINPKIDKKINSREQADIIYNSLSKQNLSLLISLNEIDMNLWESLP
jgi:hypothetical protein